MKRKIIAILLLLAICVPFSGCLQVRDPQAGDPDFESGTGEIIFADGEEKRPDEWVDGVLVSENMLYYTVMVGESIEIVGASDGYSWISDCPAVASVEDGIVTANKVGRTTVTAYSEDHIVLSATVSCEFTVSSSGFDFVTTVDDKEVYKVTSLKEANSILDMAAARHIRRVKMDFSAMSASFNVKTDFVLNSEFGGHTSLKMMYYPSTPYLVEFEIIYNTEAASYTAPLTEENTYGSIISANSIIRASLGSGEARADDYEGFAINSRTETFDVYNSEELWWAVEHGYKPTFPMEGTKAELFYERAKMILRDIITDTMTEYEKVLAIYEYLIMAVSYDYDAYYNPNIGDDEKNNTCYYLEGVFEAGRAVCDGKSKAFVLLCGIEGIDSVRAFGEIVGGGIGHAWNYVLLDGIWYMADTTNGDIRYEADSAISDFFGGRFETVGYDAFLLPAYTYYGRYEYTEMWAHLIPSNKNYEYGESYFNVNIGNTSYDFIIGSTAEAEALLRAVYEYGLPEKFVLTFQSASSFRVDSYFNLARNSWGYEVEVYKTNDGDYIAVFRSQK